MDGFVINGRVETAYGKSGERERARAGDHPMLATARKIHYCARVGGFHEDVFNHALDLLPMLFERGGFPAVTDPEAEDDDPLIVRVGYLVAALERFGDDEEPAVSLAVTRLLAVVKLLYATEVRARVSMQTGMRSLLQRADAIRRGEE